MATIEERATMFGLSHTKHIADSIRPQAVARMHDLYKEIATEQKVFDMEWACEWLKEHADEYYESSSQADDCFYDSDRMVEDFRKSIEKTI